jgi:hypothetical protein
VLAAAVVVAIQVVRVVRLRLAVELAVGLEYQRRAEPQTLAVVEEAAVVLTLELQAVQAAQASSS